MFVRTKKKYRVTSKSLCTPGCKTGILMTCAIKTATCGCHFG
ncbi:TPA: gallidermin/nisin family lantibiotic [Streptococcus suis]|nr:gallidermin/nisin family lantibiotic [Streptococcus suis]